MSNAQDNAAHTCSYSCDRPQCIKAQRDELAAAAAQEAVAEVCEDSTGCRYIHWSVEWFEGHRELLPTGTKLYAAPVAAASAEFDRARETPRRQRAVELLMSMGYRWHGGEWIESSTTAAPAMLNLANGVQLPLTADEAGYRIDPAYAQERTPAAPGIDLAALRARVVSAIERITSGTGQMRVPADLTDPDLVLADVLTLLDALDPHCTDSHKGSSEAPPMFYIQDTRGFVGNCPMWWGPDGRGYVTRLDEAGRYTEEEAIRQNKARDTDIPWPCDEIDKLARPTVDFQHMRPRSERLAELAAQAGDAEVQP